MISVSLSLLANVVNPLSFTSQSPIIAPRASKVLAVARPTPLPPPVITKTLLEIGGAMLENQRQKIVVLMEKRGWGYSIALDFSNLADDGIRTPTIYPSSSLASPLTPTKNIYF
jgi:hypothetical protein